MTGYGLAKTETEQFLLALEIKTLNSKNFDLTFRMPSVFYSKELEMRQLIAEALERGKVSVSIKLEQQNASNIASRLNKNLIAACYSTLSELANSLGGTKEGLFSAILQLPDIIQQSDNDPNIENFWPQLQILLKEALKGCNAFRQKEGALIEEHLQMCLSQIQSKHTCIAQQASKRIERVREKLQKQLQELGNSLNYDANRLEQELIFYIERLDISEEIMRLQAHLNLFEETLKLPESSGRKLGFVVQEIGREINTIGAKANDSLMQHDVVIMKDELEKIKEQLANVL